MPTPTRRITDIHKLSMLSMRRAGGDRRLPTSTYINFIRAQSRSTLLTASARSTTDLLGILTRAAALKDCEKSH